MNLQPIKQRFSIIGNNGGLNRALETAVRVASTDLSILVTGESGVGKEAIPQIIHSQSPRKHNSYIAVNCGAIPSGTMDSELFGHVKGSFTGAGTERKGYFEEASGGTIFLDEVAEMPLETQVKLLRVLEAGEFLKVGSSKVQKTDVRIVAATNVDIPKAIDAGKFREDLYYRLNTVPIHLPPLRKRKEDIHLLFRKFAADFSEKYRTPLIRLSDEAREMLERYYWHGNIRQLKNITEQLNVLEEERNVSAQTLLKYLPDLSKSNLPATRQSNTGSDSDLNEREILYKILFDLRNEMNDLKKLVGDLLKDGSISDEDTQIIKELYTEAETDPAKDPEYQALQLPAHTSEANAAQAEFQDSNFHQHQEVEESLNLEDQERILIKKALEKHNGKRKYAAEELGVSERTLYRKIKEYELS